MLTPVRLGCWGGAMHCFNMFVSASVKQAVSETVRTSARCGSYARIAFGYYVNSSAMMIFTGRLKVDRYDYFRSGDNLVAMSLFSLKVWPGADTLSASNTCTFQASLGSSR